MNNPILSVLIPVYNHEKFLRKALDSVLMQQTKYEFEVLIGEDKSQDRSKDILKEYEQNYPGFFTIFYREENMSTGPITNQTDLKRRAKGKYIITLEGDDYWLTEDKIEKQVSFLENHPEYFAVAHNCVVVDSDGRATGEFYPECKEQEYSFRHLFNNILPGQTATFMYKNCYKNYYFDTSLLEKGLVPGDRLLVFSIISKFRIFCMQETMSAYRKIKYGGTSFTATFYPKYEERYFWYRAQLEYAWKEKDSEEAVCFAQYEYFRFCLRFHSHFSLRDFFQIWASFFYRKKTFQICIKYYIKKDIFHIKEWY